MLHPAIRSLRQMLSDLHEGLMGWLAGGFSFVRSTSALVRESSRPRQAYLLGLAKFPTQPASPDPFFQAPYGDASRLNEDHSPSQASNGLYELFETHVLTGPSPVQSPLAGLSPSAAWLTAQIASPRPSYRGHSGVGGNALTDPSWSQAHRVDDGVCEPARLTANVAAFTDVRWPETRVGDAFDECGPPCSTEDPFASRVRPQAPVRAQTLPFSMPCTGPFRSDAHVGEQARAPLMAAPASEQSLLHATAAQLLNVLLEVVRPQHCALKGDPESPCARDPSWSRAHRVDDGVCEPAHLTANVAAFTDARWPETRAGNAFDGGGPPCSTEDPFASRVRPQAPVGAQTLSFSISEQSPLHATAAQLLNVLLEVVRSQHCALKGDPESPQPSVPST
ncbi:hypothetical protein HPB51_013097 [Rhipicephalus microplus]|uniref:Uncharacterized protein n=1 Tax=Rhipicephalus microplus TaxID=6941 RepID=A0A9J6F350_RHIMP|nr:hypothetical protein HPB51_013097 [Rhipicephalus microplus]